ncbi:MAG TPA: acyl-ACP thioesterase domain-containing protein [Thermoleophilaceae bacterium]
MELSEIVPVPAVGRVFEQTLRPGLADAAPSGRIRMDGLARWVQDMAYADVEDAGVEGESFWVVRRMRTRVERFPRFGETVHARTFCSGYARLWAERRVDFESDSGRVEIASVWVHLNPVSGLPAPLPESFDRFWAESAQGRKIKARLRHPNPAGDEPASDWFFRRSDADVADHVNNAAYWEPIEEKLGDPETIDAEIEFREPAQPGSARILRGADGTTWITATDGRVHASVLFGSPAAR